MIDVCCKELISRTQDLNSTSVGPTLLLLCVECSLAWPDPSRRRVWPRKTMLSAAPWLNRFGTVLLGSNEHAGFSAGWSGCGS